MNRIVTIAAVSFLLLAACTPQQDEIENQTEESANEAQQEMDGMDSATPIADSDTQASALEDEALSAQELLEQEDSPIASRVIYFEYDSAKVNDESMALLEAHGDFMSSNGNVNVILNGHADERGSREYNIALGDRRAQSVRRILLFQGASTGQIESVSYGEEKPAVFGHDEESWSKNRRVELEYQVR
ncbi:MAG: peptidoglycan-associated lipoprotein Pal [Gammaproteobacteria bacterium]|nr:peptidoglycan-associated lipoprotein Pal [Gammaproteobacteria bacterium]